MRKFYMNDEHITNSTVQNLMDVSLQLSLVTYIC